MTVDLVTGSSVGMVGLAVYLFLELSHLVSEQQLHVVQRQLNLPHLHLHSHHLPLPLILMGGEGRNYYPIIRVEGWLI